MTQAINPEPQGDVSQTLGVKKKKPVRKKKSKKKYFLLSRSLLRGVAGLFKNTKKRNLMLTRALLGGVAGLVIGWLMVKAIPGAGAVLGAALGWYLARGLWPAVHGALLGAVLGAVLGWLLIDSISGAAAGLFVGVMVACNIVGRKGRYWMALAVVVTICVVAVMGRR
jgi:hypothetical protein